MVIDSHCKSGIIPWQWPAVIVCGNGHRLPIAGRVRYHSYSGNLWQLPLTVTAGQCQSTIPLLQWESMTITVTAGYCEGTIPLLPRESMTISTDCYCWSLPGYDTTFTVRVYFHRLLLLLTARVRYHSYSESLCPLQMIVTAGHCQGRIPLLQWESMIITTDCYSWSLPVYDTTLTVRVCVHYRWLLLPVTAKVGYGIYQQ